MSSTLVTMSGSIKIDNLSDNFLNASVSKPETLTAASNIVKSNECEQLLKQQNQHSGKNQTVHLSQTFALSARKNTQHATQQQTLVTSSTNTLPTISPHLLTLPNQLRTVATIHQHHSQQQNTIEKSVPQPTNISSAATASAPALVLQQHQFAKQSPQVEATSCTSTTLASASARHVLGRLQTHKSSNDLRAPAHCIPPRYLPPPQPAGNGILKHINTLPIRGNERLAKNNFGNFVDSTQTNLKYPPDVPQLSPVYIPDSLKAQGSSSRHLQQQPHLQRYRNALLLNGNNYQKPQRCQEQIEQQQPHPQDMLKFVRKTDQDHPSPNTSVSSNTTNIPTPGSRFTAEQNRQLQSLINELRILKDQNQRLLDDNQELRDLCCFLDDDRQKGRKLAREWQRFGRYTASVMRQEVAAYQNKLRQLDDKQQELITDNLELKELCLYLDEERAHIASNALCANCGSSIRNPLRDDGDGSSSSTNAEETMATLRNYERQMPDINLRATLNDQTLQYVRSLERRIQQLEEERIIGTSPTPNIITPQPPARQQKQQPAQDNISDPISSRPEAVVRALQVLEVREQLEHDRLNTVTDSTTDQMDDGEKALVREMCNVVWRKLEGSGPPVPNSMEQL